MCRGLWALQCTATETALINVLQAETRGHVFTDFRPHQRLECLRTEEHQRETPEQHTLRDVSAYQTRKTRYHNIWSSVFVLNGVYKQLFFPPSWHLWRFNANVETHLLTWECVQQVPWPPGYMQRKALPSSSAWTRPAGVSSPPHFSTSSRDGPSFLESLKKKQERVVHVSNRNTNFSKHSDLTQSQSESSHVFIPSSSLEAFGWPSRR